MKLFVKLKAKMYTYITEDDHECKKAKDINDKLKYEDYKNVLLNATFIKISISCYDIYIIKWFSISMFFLSI